MHSFVISRQTYCKIFCVLYFFISDLSKFLAEFGISRVVSYSVFLLCFAVYIFLSHKRLSPLDCVVQFAFAFIAIYGLFRNADYIEEKTRIFAIIIVFIPAYYFFRTSSFEYLLYGLKHGSLLSGVYLIYHYLTVVRGSSGYDMNYDMDYSRGCAIPACVLFYYFLKEKRVLYLLISVVLFVTSFLAGSRSAPILTFVCWSIMLIAKMKDKRYGTIMIVFFFSVLAVARFKLEWILLDVLGFSETSRNVAKIINGEVLVSRPREQLYNEITTHISLNPFGYGPLGSRRILNLGGYPHSLFFELQLDFGVYVGIALFGIVLLMAAYLVIVNCNNELVPLILPICIIGLGVLMVSSSYYHGITVPAIFALFIREFFCKRSEFEPVVTGFR